MAITSNEAGTGWDRMTLTEHYRYYQGGWYGPRRHRRVRWRIHYLRYWYPDFCYKDTPIHYHFRKRGPNKAG